MITTGRIALFAGLVWIAAACPGVAHAQQSWVGKSVVTKTNPPRRAAATIAGDSAATSFKRATIWMEREGCRLAFADYNETTRLDPSDAFEYVVRGIEWSRKKEYDRAIADFSEAIRLDPTITFAYMARGFAWERKKEYDKGIADYSEAIRLDPTYALAYNGRGLAWFHKKDYDRAIADYNETIRLDPRDAGAYNNRGNARQRKKEYEKAMADYNEAIRIDPKYAYAYSDRGWAWANKKEYDKAIADYNKAIRVDPSLAAPYDGRSWLRATCPDVKFRDGKKAVEDGTRACELSRWNEANSIGTLAAAYAESGAFEKAVATQQKASALSTDAEDRRKAETRLALYKEKKPYRQSDED